MNLTIGLTKDKKQPYTMHFEFLVEELSAKIALENILPKLLPEDASFCIHPFQGKHDLLLKMYARLRTYKLYMDSSHRVVVLIDRDNDNCMELKDKLDNITLRSGFISKSTAKNNSSFQVLNRIAIEELEAWFFGDVDAIVKAFPRVPVTLHKRAAFRDPDSIKGGTWEALERLLKKYKYYKSRASKTDVAKQISQYMQPDNNRSKSFQVFISGLNELSNIS